MINLKNIEMIYDDNGTKINALKVKKLDYNPVIKSPIKGV